MKKLFLLLIFIFSFLSCDGFIQDSESFYVGTCVNDSDISVSWIYKGVIGNETLLDEDLSLKGNKLDDIKYDLMYSTEYENPPKFKNIKILDTDKSISVKDVKSPYVITGLEKGKTYYIMLRAYVGSSATNEGLSEVFEVKVP